LIDAHPALRRGVLYIEDFDDPPGSALVPVQNAPGILVPSFSAEDLEAARQQAYAEGVRDGQQAAAGERVHAVRLLLETLGKSLAQAQRDLMVQAETIAEELARTLLATLCGSLPDLCRAHAEPETRALIRRLMPGLAREPRLEIRVHPDLVAAVENELAHLAQELPGKLDVVGDSKLEPTDLRANYQDGRVIRSSRQIWAEVRAQLEEFGLLLPPATPDSEKPHAG